MGLGRCKGCGAKIFWVKTVDGRNMPCDPKLLPVRRGEGGERFINQGGVVLLGHEAPEKQANSFAFRPHGCPAFMGRGRLAQQTAEPDAQEREQHAKRDWPRREGTCTAAEQFKRGK